MIKDVYAPFLSGYVSSWIQTRDLMVSTLLPLPCPFLLCSPTQSRTSNQTVKSFTNHNPYFMGPQTLCFMPNNSFYWMFLLHLLLLQLLSTADSQRYRENILLNLFVIDHLLYSCGQHLIARMFCVDWFPSCGWQWFIKSHVYEYILQFRWLCSQPFSLLQDVWAMS